jgi:hypothetical protein
MYRNLYKEFVRFIDNIFPSDFPDAYMSGVRHLAFTDRADCGWQPVTPGISSPSRRRAGGQTRSFLNPLLMFFRSMVGLPACHAGCCHGYAKNFWLNNNTQINVRGLRAMAGRSHQPYYFSTRWNTNGPNIPSFHRSIIPIVSEANQFLFATKVFLNYRSIISRLGGFPCKSKIKKRANSSGSNLTKLI